MVIRYLFIISLFLSFSTQAMAGAFKVVPNRIFLEASKPGDKVTKSIAITNNGAEKITVQLSAVTWGQDETGIDVYTPTKEIIFFPKLITIAPEAKKIIRIGDNATNMSNDNQRTYRVYIRELPVAKPGEAVMMMALNVGVPIFIAPVEETKGASIEKVEFTDDALSVNIKNSGNSHIIANKITVTGFDESGNEVFTVSEGGWYVLSDVTRSFSVKIPNKDCSSSKTFKISTGILRGSKTSVEETLETQIEVDTDLCPKDPPPPSRNSADSFQRKRKVE